MDLGEYTRWSEKELNGTNIQTKMICYGIVELGEYTRWSEKERNGTHIPTKNDMLWDVETIEE